MPTPFVLPWMAHEEPDGRWRVWRGADQQYFATEHEAWEYVTMTAKTDAFISGARDSAQKLWDALHELKTMQDEWTALDYGTTLPDGTGENTGLTKAEISAVVFTTTDALKGLLDQGHATNLAKLLR